MKQQPETPYIEGLLAAIASRGDLDACWWSGRTYAYSDLGRMIEEWEGHLAEVGIGRGDICGIHGDYSPRVCALILALMKIGGVCVPFSPSIEHLMPSLCSLAGVRTLFHFDASDEHRLESLPGTRVPDLVEDFLATGHSGLIVFTSGSTGEPKGILHDCERLVKKFSTPRTGYRTLLFLMIDHFGGFNTFLAVLSNGGTMVMPRGRMPSEVALTIEQAQVELLPVTPTFLNLLLASGIGETHSMSSVTLITYGTEVMPESTLERIRALFPRARLQQTYGLSELGVLRSKSKNSDSLWVKIGGQGFETRVVDGILHIRSESAMVGYLNEESPFDDEGWMNTGDRVEQDGDYLRILGRDSEIINVGGRKVFPAEVETVLLKDPNVVDATVHGEKHPLMGEVVVARISLVEAENPGSMKTRLRKLGLANLDPFKVPIKFTVTADSHHSARFKKTRP